jgi:hypothetical protein
VHLGADRYRTSISIHGAVDLHQGESERVAEWDQFGGTLRRLDAGEFGGTEDRAFRCLSALNQIKYFAGDGNAARSNGAPIGHWFRANIDHRRASIRANMRESLLFHALILAVWRGDATRCARKWMQFNRFASGIFADLFWHDPQIVGPRQH